MNTEFDVKKYETIRKRVVLFINASRRIKLLREIKRKRNYPFEKVDAEVHAILFGRVLLQIGAFFTASTKKQGLIARIKGAFKKKSMRKQLKEYEATRKRVVQFIASSKMMRKNLRYVQDEFLLGMKNDENLMQYEEVRKTVTKISDERARGYVLAFGSMLIRLAQLFTDPVSRTKKRVKDEVLNDYYKDRYDKLLLAKIRS